MDFHYLNYSLHSHYPSGVLHKHIMPSQRRRDSVYSPVPNYYLQLLAKPSSFALIYFNYIALASYSDVSAYNKVYCKQPTEKGKDWYSDVNKIFIKLFHYYKSSDTFTLYLRFNISFIMFDSVIRFILLKASSLYFSQHYSLP